MEHPKKNQSKILQNGNLSKRMFLMKMHKTPKSKVSLNITHRICLSMETSSVPKRYSELSRHQESKQRTKKKMKMRLLGTLQ